MDKICHFSRVCERCEVVRRQNKLNCKGAHGGGVRTQPASRRGAGETCGPAWRRRLRRQRARQGPAWAGTQGCKSRGIPTRGSLHSCSRPLGALRRNTSPEMGDGVGRAQGCSESPTAVGQTRRPRPLPPLCPSVREPHHPPHLPGPPLSRGAPSPTPHLAFPTTGHKEA